MVYNFGRLPIANNLDHFKDTKTERFDLKLVVCKSCFLVQTSKNLPKVKIFSDKYPYLSSSSKTLLLQSQVLAKNTISKFNLNSKSFITEIASNDGYLLQYFKKKKINCLGVEPTKIPFLASKKKGILSMNNFFDFKLSKDIIKKYGKSDVVIANNVIAHIPNLNNFTKGLINLLKQNGVLIVEFQYLNSMIKKKLFDNIYHEHYYYYSLNSFQKIIDKFSCKIINYDELPAHGGSLRVYITRKKNILKVSKKVERLLKYEKKLGVNNLDYYLKIARSIKEKIQSTKNFLLYIKKLNKKVAGFGAAAKTASILNFCKIDHNTIDFVFDNASSKINKSIPGTKIKILKPTKNLFESIDILIIFVWNLKNEILSQIKKYGKKKIGIYIFTPKIKKIL
jgi:SAM-dependent methyltransferase